MSRSPLLLLALALTACGGSPSHEAVARVSVTPDPEGPQPLTASATKRAGTVPLARIAFALPRSFPANPAQTCRVGVIVGIAFDNGKALTYGPCRRPPSIERLRLALIHLAVRDSRTAPPPLPIALQTPPNAWTPWRSVLADWYDNGRIDSWHSCAAVREALAHLPPDGGPVYSTVGPDLQAFARIVC